jgi:hypothetical protein
MGAGEEGMFINILLIVALAAIVAFTLTRGLQGLKLFAALIAVVVLAVLVWNVTVSLRQ